MYKYIVIFLVAILGSMVLSVRMVLSVQLSLILSTKNLLFIIVILLSI